ncbi:MAG: ribosomal protein S18-alanine N-acetyltransferase [Bermanella sp.]
MTLGDLAEVFAIDCQTNDFPWTQSLFEQALASTKKTSVIEEQGEILGFSIVSYVVGEAELLNICIAKQQQGKKLGNQLLEHVLAQAKQSENHEMYLEVRASNIAALALYEKHDFNEIGRRTDYYPMKGGREDAILMARSLLF